jgi:hypothetical protein
MNRMWLVLMLLRAGFAEAQGVVINPPRPAPTCKADTPSDKDRIDLAFNDEGLKITLLVDGQRSSNCTTHQEIDGRGVLSIDNLRRSTSCPGEIAMFAPGHRMQVADDQSCFTDDADRITFDVSAPPVEVPVTVWSVNVPSTQEPQLRQRVTADIMFANAAYSSPGCGIEMGRPLFKSGSMSVALSCSALRQQVGFDQTRLNLYYLASDLSVLGFECQNEDRDMLVMGANSRSATLAHEFGHALMLEHVPDIYNIMSTQSVVRREVTVGQCYAANLNGHSFVQDHQIIPAPRVARGCTGSVAGGPGCPPGLCPGCHDRSLTDLLRPFSRSPGISPTAASLLSIDAGARGSTTEMAAPIALSASDLSTSPADAFQQVLAQGLPADLSVVTTRYLRESFYQIKLYEVSHTAWQMPFTESDYVSQQFAKTVSALQLRALEGLGQRGNGKDLINGARLNGIRLGKLTPDVVRAIDAALQRQ